MSPIVAVIKARPVSLLQFLTRLCAVIGGVFAVTGAHIPCDVCLAWLWGLGIPCSSHRGIQVGGALAYLAAVIMQCITAGRDLKMLLRHLLRTQPDGA
jgi:hypothetical protein